MEESNPTTTFHLTAFRLNPPIHNVPIERSLLFGFAPGAEVLLGEWLKNWKFFLVSEASSNVPFCARPALSESNFSIDFVPSALPSDLTRNKTQQTAASLGRACVAWMALRLAQQRCGAQWHLTFGTMSSDVRVLVGVSRSAGQVCVLPSSGSCKERAVSKVMKTMCHHSQTFMLVSIGRRDCHLFVCHGWQVTWGHWCLLLNPEIRVRFLVSERYSWSLGIFGLRLWSFSYHPSSPFGDPCQQPK